MNLEKEIFEISLNDIIPNRFQPREIFNNNELNELAESIKQHGVIQPIIVRKVGDKYEIIAGERRFRASQIAGKETIPALVRDIDDKEVAKIALLENLQRSNLTPIEEAKTYQTILKIDNITQDELAANLGKSQGAVANKLRLLTLDEEVQTALLNSQISERHARSLIGLDNQKQKELLHKTINEKLTVRQLDEEVMKVTGKMPNSQIEPEIAIHMKNQAIPRKTGIMSDQIKETPVVPNPEENNVEVANMNQNAINSEAPVQNEAPSVTVSEPLIPTPERVEPVTEPTVPVLEEQSVIPETETTPSIENETQNIQEQPKTENIFDKLRITPEETNPEQEDSKIDLSNVNPEQALSHITEGNNESEQTNNQDYNDIYDLRFAINNFRQAIQNTEKFGFKVNTTEEDNEDKYKIVIEIDKK